MLEEINYHNISLKQQRCYGKEAELGMGIITAFAIVAIITVVVVYKLYGLKSGDITLPGVLKFEFTT